MWMQATLEYLEKNGMRKSLYRHFIFLNSSVRGKSSQLIKLIACCPGIIAKAAIPLILSCEKDGYVEANIWVIAIFMQVPFILLTCLPVGNGQMLLCKK